MPLFIFAAIGAAVAAFATAASNLLSQYITRRDEARQTLHARLQAEQRLAAENKVRLAREAAEADKKRLEEATRRAEADIMLREARTKKERDAALEAASLAAVREREAAAYAQRKAEEAAAAKARADDDFPDMDRTVPEMISAAKRKRGVKFDKQFNIAVIGARGQGKSSLINIIRHTPGAAANVNECTQSATAYPHPGFPELVWHDLPGANTVTQPLRTYFRDQELFVYDAFIFCSTDTFSATPDAHLTDVLTRQYQKPVAAVRTKCDEPVRNLTNQKVCEFNGTPMMTEEEAIRHLKDTWPTVVEGAMEAVANKKRLSAVERANHHQLVRSYVISAHEALRDRSAAYAKGYEFEKLGGWLLEVLPRELAALIKVRMEMNGNRDAHGHPPGHPRPPEGAATSQLGESPRNGLFEVRQLAAALEEHQQGYEAASNKELVRMMRERGISRVGLFERNELIAALMDADRRNS